MTDNELIELAAKAIGLGKVRDCLGHERIETEVIGKTHYSSACGWNPLDHDGQAFRLAVKLSQMDGGIALCLNSRLSSVGFARCHTSMHVVSPAESMHEDPYAATRRVIVRAAAEIGFNMEEIKDNA